MKVENSDPNSDSDGDVEVSVTMSGNYESVLTKLGSPDDGADELAPLLGDVTKLLETVQRTGGGTRSVIVEEIPPGTAVDFDGEAVSEMLRVLERYDLVALEGNTWKPGPALSASR